MLVTTALLLLLVAGSQAVDCPECDMDTLGLIEHWGYEAREHLVTTEDGYILAIHQIVGKRNNPPKLADSQRPVVFMQHGLEASSSNWVTNMPWQSAGFMFSDAGFDVYLGNMRGNTYCKQHINRKPTDEAFWNFSFDEMAKYDLPAMIDFVLQATNQSSLYYMGHSQGTMIVFAHQSTNPEFAPKINKFFALAPVGRMEHISGLIAYMAPYTNQLADILKWLGGWGEFLPSSKLMDEFAKEVCGFWETEPLCDDLLFLLAGPDSHQLNKSRTDVYISHTPAGTSTQNVVHFGQLVNTNEYQMYDWNIFDKNGNMDHYGQATPPKYDVTKCTIPTYFFKGDLDILADEEDIKWLERNVPNIVTNKLLTGFNHLDFIWGLHAGSDIYQPIIDVIKADVKQQQIRDKLRIST